MCLVCLLFIQKQSFVLLGQIQLALSPCSIFFRPHPLSPVFVSYFMLSILLEHINMHCAENFVLGVLSCYFSFNLSKIQSYLVAFCSFSVA